jgi:hypothetical protein
MKKPTKEMERRAGKVLSTAKPGSNPSHLAGRVLREGRTTPRRGR